MIKFHLYPLHTIALVICALFLMWLGTNPSVQCRFFDLYQLPSRIYCDALGGLCWLLFPQFPVGVPLFSLLLILLLVLSFTHVLSGFTLILVNLFLLWLVILAVCCRFLIWLLWAILPLLGTQHMHVDIYFFVMFWLDIILCCWTVRGLGGLVAWYPHFHFPL